MPCAGAFPVHARGDEIVLDRPARRYLTRPVQMTLTAMTLMHVNQMPVSAESSCFLNNILQISEATLRIVL